MKKGMKGWLGILVVSLTAGMLHAAQESVVVLWANESPPYWSQKLPGGGMGGEIVQAISKEMGMKTRIEFRPLKRIIADTKTNPLGNPLFYMYNQDFAAIIPIALTYNAFFVYRKGGKQPSLPLTNTKMKTIGVLKGTIANPSVPSPFGRFEESYTRDSLFKKLKLGRIDTVAELHLVGKETIKKLFANEADDFEIRIIKESAAPIAIMIDSDYPDAPAIGRRYQEGLHRIIKNGLHRKIIQKYYGKTAIPQNWYNELSKYETLYTMSSGGNSL